MGGLGGAWTVREGGDSAVFRGGGRGAAVQAGVVGLVCWAGGDVAWGGDGRVRG